jgi:hypothetical protein
MSAGQEIGPPKRENRTLLPAPLPPDEVRGTLAAAAGVSTVGLRPPFDTPAAAFSSCLSRHSHLDCRAASPLVLLFPDTGESPSEPSCCIWKPSIGTARNTSPRVSQRPKSRLRYRPYTPVLPPSRRKTARSALRSRASPQRISHSPPRFVSAHDEALRYRKMDNDGKHRRHVRRRRAASPNPCRHP